uniref:CX domain-containing protein n=1 Tax=Plectus sambesii TaxID=2011161 RepID=A0A914WYE3_9BILA
MRLNGWVSALFVIILLVRVDVVKSRGGLDGGERDGGHVNGSEWSSTGSSDKGSSNRGGGASTSSKRADLGSITRGRSLKKAITGAAAGYLTYKSGKAIINRVDAAMMWNSRPYYWGPSYYEYQSGYTMCSMPLDNPKDTTFSDIFFEDLSRPVMIVWGCRKDSESCCGYECCPNNPINVWNIIGPVLAGVILLFSCGCYILYRPRRKEEENRREAEVPERVPMNSQPCSTGSYPMHPYPNPAYPMQPQYPQQLPPPHPHPNQAYPMQPQYPQEPPPPYGFKPY